MDSFINLFFDLFSRYAEVMFLYIPLGIIGIWRWGVWVIRKSVSFFYRMPGGTYPASLSVVTPVYNEDPGLFRRALDSWANNNVDEIVAVIDYSDEKNIRVFKDFQQSHPEAKLIVTEKPGKRPALADGTRAASGEIVALVDSDTVWSPNIKSSILGPFSDPKVGGLVTRQDVFETDTLARKIFKVLLDDRYLLEYPFLSTVSDALLCLSGRTAVYRKNAIIGELDELVNEKFWGKKMISGDDKTLTRLVQRKGWKTRYLKNVVVYTSGLPSMSSFMKQKLRWTRNGLRSDSKILFNKWIWKNHKMLALHMLDKFISPVTLILGPIYLVVALYFGHYEIAAAIVIWWIVSRAVKIFPHLSEKPSDIFILPAYILMTYVMSVVKIYALATVDEQGWITRWSKERRITANFFHRASAYMVTGTVIFLMFFIIFTYQNQQLVLAQAEKEKANELRENMRIESLYSFMTPELPRPSDAEIETMKTALMKTNQSDQYGYYVVKAGDTTATFRKKYNLPATARILDAKTKTSLSSFAALKTGQAIAVSVASLRNPMQTDILAPTSQTKPPRVNYDAISNTIFVRQGGSVATPAKINQALPLANKKLFEQTAPGEWILRANLYIAKDVTLALDGSQVKYLKLKSDSDGFVWLRSQSGSIFINKTKITSWDEKMNAPDTEHESGRAYVTAKNSGRMDILDSELAYLGYAGLPKRGGPFGGSYGVSWKNESAGFRNELLTGVVINNKLHDNYFGFYTFGVTGMLVRGNEAYGNIEYGFDPHDDSNNMLIENNRAHNNGNHGIIISRRCFNNSIVNNESFNNRLHGIMIDRESNNNLVEGNMVYGNVDGFAVYGSNGNVFLDNDSTGNQRGVRLNAGSADNFFENNVISENSRGVYIYGGATNNLLVRNEIKNNEIGITIMNASKNMLFDNFSKFDNQRDGRVTEDAYENNIQ